MWIRDSPCGNSRIFQSANMFFYLILYQADPTWSFNSVEICCYFQMVRLDTDSGCSSPLGSCEKVQVGAAVAVAVLVLVVGCAASCAGYGYSRDIEK
jgi:hypothetical protein